MWKNRRRQAKLIMLINTVLAVNQFFIGEQESENFDAKDKEEND